MGRVPGTWQMSCDQVTAEWRTGLMGIERKDGGIERIKEIQYRQDQDAGADKAELGPVLYLLGVNRIQLSIIVLNREIIKRLIRVINLNICTIIYSEQNSQVSVYCSVSRQIYISAGVPYLFCLLLYFLHLFAIALSIYLILQQFQKYFSRIVSSQIEYYYILRLMA